MAHSWEGMSSVSFFLSACVVVRSFPILFSFVFIVLIILNFLYFQKKEAISNFWKWSNVSHTDDDCRTTPNLTDERCKFYNSIFFHSHFSCRGGFVLIFGNSWNFFIPFDFHLFCVSSNFCDIFIVFQVFFFYFHLKIMSKSLISSRFLLQNKANFLSLCSKTIS